MKNYSVKAIVIGFLFNFLGGILASLIFSAIWYATAFTGNTDTFEYEYSRSLFVRVVMLLIGVTFAFLSGYLCAHLAKQDKILNAIVLGVIITLFSAGFIALNPDAAPLWSQALSLLLFLPLTYLGGKAKLNLIKNNT